MHFQNRNFVLAVWVLFMIISIVGIVVGASKASSDAVLQSIASIVGGAIAAVAAIFAVTYQLTMLSRQAQKREDALREVIRNAIFPTVIQIEVMIRGYLRSINDYPNYSDRPHLLDGATNAFTAPRKATESLIAIDPLFEHRWTEMDGLRSAFAKAYREVRRIKEECVERKVSLHGSTIKAHDELMLTMFRYAEGIAGLMESLKPEARHDAVIRKLNVSANTASSYFSNQHAS